MIELKDVSKVYQGNKIAVQNVSLKFNDGEFICLIGSSGSGKTTCMRMINRMNIPSRGDIFINGKDIKAMNAVELRRKIGYVIQQIGLMPHMSVYENITLVPKLLKWNEQEMKQTALELLKKVGLDEGYLTMYPHELSGGQQQRVGVIRALAANQEIILMDEPFGALDPITRASLQNLIKKLHKEMKKTIVFVTHDMDEALQLADRVVIMDKGSVIQFDTPENILTNPKNDFVKDMLGEQRLHQAAFDYQTVETIMNDSPVTVQLDCSTNDAIEIMRKHHVDTLFVTDGEHKLMGVVDIFKISKKREITSKISDYLQEVSSLPKETIVRDAIHFINDLGYRNMPVVDQEGIMVGLITRASIVDVMCSGLWNNYVPSDDILNTTSLERCEITYD